jgi:hypothetical protein
MKNDSFDNRISLAHNHSKIPEDKTSMGSTKGKYPIVMDHGRTIVFISDLSKEAETRLKYEMLKNSRFPSHNAKH